jgi:hypothetical protein
MGKKLHSFYFKGRTWIENVYKRTKENTLT